MSKVLTIAIPTYNRAELLNKQLEWIANSIKGNALHYEILVSDNCSSDHTQDVLRKWRTVINGLQVHRQAENVGALRNIVYCIKSASSRYTWVLSDDDHMFTQSLESIVRYIREHSDLALLFLNYSSRSGSGELKSRQRFRLSEDDENANGKALFEKYIAKGGGTGALVFTSALVYRTALAKKAIDEWPSGVSNLAYQLYVTGYCAMKGRFLVTKDKYLEFIGGRSHFQRDRKLFIQIKVADAPEIYAKFAELGYSSDLCRKLLKRHLNNSSLWIGVMKWSVTNPFTTLKALLRLLDAMRCLFIETRIVNVVKGKIETSH